MTRGLRIEGLSHAYDRDTVLEDVDIAVEEGEVVCLLGPSGSGKSTVLRLAAGLEQVQQGLIRIGRDVVGAPDKHIPPERRRIGLVLQDFALFPDRSVARNVAFGLVGWPRGKIKARVDELLARVGLTGEAARYPASLSGGQQQRVALARALAPNPQIMLMDEPFSSLDAALRQSLSEETLRLLKEDGVPALVVTHDPNEAVMLADRIVILDAGRVVQTGSARDIYTKPATREIATLFGRLNAFPAHVAKGIAKTAHGDVPLAGADSLPGDVTLYVRELGIVLEPGRLPVTHRVTAVRLLGSAGRAELVPLEKREGEPDKVYVRMRVGQIPVAGQELCFRLDPRECFVFPS